jgi:hypothetical protein
VEKGTKARIVQFLRPLILGIGFVLKVAYYLVFAWRLTPWLRHSANRELVKETERSLWFLIPKAGAVSVLDGDWPRVQIFSGKLLFTILRWQDATTVSAGPIHSPSQSCQLGALDDVARLLQSRLEDLNAAFSEEEFSRVREDFSVWDFMQSR